MSDIVDMIIEYEEGTMSVNRTIDFFAGLIADGQAWTLQGAYGRQARALINNGYISKEGKVLKYVEEESSM